MSQVLDEQSSGNLGYGDFGKRLGASIVDGLVLIIPMGLIYYFTLGAVIRRAAELQRKAIMGAFSDDSLSNLEDMYTEALELQSTMMTKGILMAVLIILVRALYFAYFESSAKQATIGKGAMGLKVTDMNGQRLTFGKAFVRGIVRAILGGIFWIVCAFTAKKQNLHDMIAGTLVWRTK